MEAYTSLANHYNRLMKGFNYQCYFEQVSEYLKGDVVELAVGSGSFTKFLATIAKSVVGVDKSIEMLNMANFELKKLKNVVLLQNDMVKFKPIKPVNTFISVCDGFNYLNSKEMAITIKNVHDNLLEGGHLIFDISSEYKLKNIIGNNVFFEDLSDLTYIWTNTCNENNVEMDLIIFKKLNGSYNRHDESHTQYIYNQNFILSILNISGFSVKVLDGETFLKPENESNRLLFICEKK